MGQSTIKMRRILIIIGHYLPGYKDGGPVRSIKNLVDRMGTEYSMHILTSDRDSGDSEPYSDIVYDDWNNVGLSKVCYVKPGGFDKETVMKLACDMNVIYVCGCYNDYARTVLSLKHAGKINTPVVVAAMGLFRDGAMKSGYLKKKLYLTALKTMGWFSDISWSATSEIEVEEIRKQIGKNAKCYIASDLPRIYEESSCNHIKQEGELKLLFLSRICQQKNLDYVIECLKEIDVTIDFTIAGPDEDIEYVEFCKSKLKELPTNITYKFAGMIPSEGVVEYMRDFDAFILPTKSENYGHAIYESMLAGLIPILSDNTIWTNDILGQELGYAISLDDRCTFSAAIKELADMDGNEFNNKRRKVLDYIRKYSDSISTEGYKKIFDIK